MLMSLPWPPDGLTHHSRALGSGSSIETIVSGGEQVIRDKSVDLRDRLGGIPGITIGEKTYPISE